MAHYELHTLFSARLPHPVQALRRFLDTPFDARQREIRQRVAEMRALTDAELAERGVRRREILAYVLRKMDEPSPRIR